MAEQLKPKPTPEDSPKSDESPKPKETPQPPPTPPVSAWTYLNLALNAALILLCLFILQIVQDIKKSVDSPQQPITKPQPQLRAPSAE